MKKSFMFATVALALFAGCGKKDETAKTETKTVDKAPSPTPAPTPAPPAEPDKLQDVAEAPEGIPKECSDARALYVKVHDCTALDEKTRASLVKSWNDMVEGTLKRWKDGSDKDKQTVLDICKKLPDTLNMLIKDC